MYLYCEFAQQKPMHQWFTFYACVKIAVWENIWTAAKLRKEIDITSFCTVCKMKKKALILVHYENVTNEIS
jgi:hypothetical protein